MGEGESGSAMVAIMKGSIYSFGIASNLSCWYSFLAFRHKGFVYLYLFIYFISDKSLILISFIVGRELLFYFFNIYYFRSSDDSKKKIL